MIAFKARVRDPAIPSYRYRVLAPIAALRGLGCAAEEFDPNRQYEAVVFSKAYGAEDQALARRLQAEGVRCLLDLCDNHFHNPYDLADYRHAAADIRAMIEACDGVICSTPVLAAQVQIEAGLSERPAVAPDIYEQARAHVADPTPMDQPARLLWFGGHGSPNAPAGMEDLLLIRAALAEAFAARPFTLTICSNSRQVYEALAAAFPVPTRYVEWSPAALEHELAATDGVLIPLSDNPFVAGKTHNRLTLALSAGVPVVADDLDSYRPFADFAVLDDWRGGLRAVLLDPVGARVRAAGAVALLRRDWSAQAVGPAWAAAIGVEIKSAPPARQALPSVQAWLAEAGRIQLPWLLVGADARPEAIAAARAEGFQVLALGAAAFRIGADAAFVADLSAFDDGREIPGAGMAWVPAYPRRDGTAAEDSLDDLARAPGPLAALAAQNRLLRLAPWPQAEADLMGDYADEACALRILALAGVAVVRSLGLRRQTSGFEAAAPLGERRSGGVAAVRRATGVSYGPFGYPLPARVFVGGDAEQGLGARVLDYSIQKHSSMDVVVEVLDIADIPVPTDPKNQSKTGFSFARFDIPRLCGYAGRGIYVDADMLVLGDIADLWTQSLDEADLLYSLSHPQMGRTPQTAVMLLNCAALPWDVKAIVGGLDEGAYSYGELMAGLCIVPQDRQQPALPYWWNSLERYDPGRTCLLHYTDMPTQPWVTQNRNGHLWLRYLREALDEGFISSAEVADAVRRGHVSPQLPEWIGRPDLAGDEAAAAVWIAPFNRFVQSQASLEGRVTLTSTGALAGWAFHPTRPETRVTLAVLENGQEILRLQASEPAEILRRYGKGDGGHAFTAVLPPAGDTEATELRIVAVDLGLDLPGSPLERPAAVP